MTPEKQQPGQRLIRITTCTARSRIYGNPSTYVATLHEPYYDGPKGDACPGHWHPEGGVCHRCCRVVGETRGHATTQAAIDAAVALAKRRGLIVRKDRISARAVLANAFGQHPDPDRRKP